jgi:chlorobactene glucosyltransferase
MIMIVEVVLIGITSAVLGTWIYLFLYALKTYKHAPRLEYAEIATEPRVDIIVPARNEERFIGRCLDSLLNQDYKNYRIIAVDDASRDRTAEIIRQYADRNDRVKFIRLDSKPDGWVGKNWACYNAYLNSNAELLLFTDADTLHNPKLLRLALSSMLRYDLDALTLVPRLECIDRWSKATVPLLLTFLYSRYSPLRVNDSKSNVGYFFGSYYIIKRSVYEAIGTHSSVRAEIIEDGALGSRTKGKGFKLRMYLADELFYAVWSRDIKTLINGLARLMLPIYALSKGKAIGIVALIFFLFVYPVMLVPYSLLVSSNPLLYINLAIDTIMVMTSILHTIKGIGIRVNAMYGLCAPIAAFIIFYGFLTGMRSSGVRWRERLYSYNVYRGDGFRL